MIVIDIARILTTLAASRPLFHSEADFQHALAWRIHELCPNCSIRLEMRPPHTENRVYLDIWVTGQRATAIELKYKTRGLRATVDGEAFELRDQSAQNFGRYDFLKDVQRLEQVISGSRGVAGYALLLTNDSAYWRPPRDPAPADASFRLHHGSVVAGPLDWAPRRLKGTMSGSRPPLSIHGPYRLLWRDYSAPVSGPYGKLRYLLVTVEGDTDP